MIGECGPELLRFPVGAHVYSATVTRGVVTAEYLDGQRLRPRLLRRFVAALIARLTH